MDIFIHIFKHLQYKWTAYCGMVKIKESEYECEGWIEKSVLRITDWHQETCPVMTNSDREGIFFYPTLKQIMDSFFAHH